jgi:orotate phosphoribosyltransferase
MSPSVIFQVIEWAGIIVIAVYALVAAYRDIVENLYEKGIPLPRSIEETVYSRKEREIRGILARMGITRRVDQYAQLSQILDVTEQRPARDYRRELERIVAMHISLSPVKVGKTYTSVFEYYIDIMGACTDYRVAERCARILANFIRDETAKALLDNEVDSIVYNRIVVPKGGTPTLGFMLSYVLRVPCTFFRGSEDPKVRDPAPVEAYFDGEILPGDKVILVDDSTTGGRMFNQAILKIREAGAEIRHGFVLFEPLGKDARGRLRHAGLDLHSVFKVDEDLLNRVTNQAKRLQGKRLQEC